VAWGARMTPKFTSGATLMRNYRNKRLFSATLFALVSPTRIFTANGQTSQNATETRASSGHVSASGPYYALLIGNKLPICG
jgi:hypothetical protein